MRDLSRGDRGKEVLDVQTRLRGQGFELGREGVDGFFGPHTEAAVLSFQQERGLLADGRVGANTWRELVESGYALGDRLLYLREPPFRGDDVLRLQVKLNLLGFNAGPERGVHDEEVERAVLDFQRNAGLPPDGIVGESTLRKLEAVRKAESGREGKKIPERDRGYAAARSLTGQSVTIDPGHGGADLGCVSAAGARREGRRRSPWACGWRNCCAPRAAACSSRARRTSACRCTRAPTRPTARPPTSSSRCTATRRASPAARGGGGLLLPAQPLLLGARTPAGRLHRRPHGGRRRAVAGPVRAQLRPAARGPGHRPRGRAAVPHQPGGRGPGTAARSTSSELARALAGGFADYLARVPLADEEEAS